MKNKELEMKFQIDEKYLSIIFSQADSSYTIMQGYVGDSNNVRVRCTNENGICLSYLTLKGRREGISRDEFEYDIPYSEGVSILEDLCDSVILKCRYLVKHKKNNWEIDVFQGDNSGLIIAELEVPKLDYDVEMPEWIDQWVEVSKDDKYYNAYLAKHPYRKWGDIEDINNE